MLLGTGCEEVPSCQQAMSHYYGAQCTYVNSETGHVYSQSEFTSACREILVEIPDACQDAMDEWLICNNNVEGPTVDKCDCSQEFDELLICAR